MGLLASLPPPDTAVAISRSLHGLGGVLFLDFASGERAVLKALADDVEAGGALFCREICRTAGIAHPEVALVDTTAGLGAELAAAARRLAVAAHDALAPAAREQLERSVENVFGWHRALLMGFVRGGVEMLPAGDPELCRRRLEAHASSVGRVMAVDLVLNNWDRVGIAALSSWLPDPAGAWTPMDGPGNPDNLFLSAADAAAAELVAIDTDLKRGYPQPAATDASFLADVSALLADLRESERRGRTGVVVREAQRCFERKRGVPALTDGALAALQRGLVETLSLLAREEAALVVQLRMALCAAASEQPEAAAVAKTLVARTGRVLRAVDEILLALPEVEPASDVVRGRWRKVPPKDDVEFGEQLVARGVATEEELKEREARRAARRKAAEERGPGHDSATSAQRPPKLSKAKLTNDHLERIGSGSGRDHSPATGLSL